MVQWFARVVLGSLLMMAVVTELPGQTSGNSGIGIGVIIGDPTGISVKWWKSPSQAYQLGGAWSFVGEGAVHLHGDVVFHQNHLIQQAPEGFSTYLGIGVRTKLERSFRMGIRLPLGLSYRFPQAPLDFFLEVVPIMDLFPATELRMNGGFGIRYYFSLRGGA